MHRPDHISMPGLTNRLETLWAVPPRPEFRSDARDRFLQAALATPPLAVRRGPWGLPSMPIRQVLAAGLTLTLATSTILQAAATPSRPSSIFEPIPLVAPLVLPVSSVAPLLYDADWPSTTSPIGASPIEASAPPAVLAQARARGVPVTVLLEIAGAMAVGTWEEALALAVVAVDPTQPARAQVSVSAQQPETLPQSDSNLSSRLRDSRGSSASPPSTSGGSSPPGPSSAASTGPPSGSAAAAPTSSSNNTPAPSESVAVQSSSLEPQARPRSPAPPRAVVPAQSEADSSPAPTESRPRPNERAQATLNEPTNEPANESSETAAPATEAPRGSEKSGTGHEDPAPAPKSERSGSPLAPTRESEDEPRGRSEPSKPDQTGKTEERDASKNDSGPSDASRSDASKAEPSRGSTPKVEAPVAEAPRTETAKIDAPKSAPPNADAPKSDASKDGSDKSDSPAPAPKVDAPKVEAPKAEAPKTAAPKASAPQPSSPTAAPSGPIKAPAKNQDQKGNGQKAPDNKSKN